MESNTYFIRGKRVPYLPDDEIVNLAKNVFRAIGGKKSIRKRMDCFIENLPQPIMVEIYEDDQWPCLLKASCEPHRLKIKMPNSLYISICDGDQEAMFVFFHELGHIFLSHNPDLHFESSSIPNRNEDSEYQADLFSETIMKNLFPKNGGEISRSEQLRFNFEKTPESYSSRAFW